MVTTAPSLAQCTLIQLAIDVGVKLPCAAAALSDKFYVDDIIVGLPILAEAVACRQKLTSLLAIHFLSGSLTSRLSLQIYLYLYLYSTCTISYCPISC